MVLSPIDLCSRALLKIGANGISSFQEGTAEAEVAASLYEPVRDALLAAHPWNFALTQASLARLLDVPVADYAYSFQLPNDCLRVISAGADGRGRGLRYRISGRRLQTDSESAIATYVCRGPESDFPPYFTMALIALLAAEFCIPLTDSTSRWDALRKMADLEFRRARLIDAQEETPAALEDFTLIEERG